ncbi:DUF6338 family protein [Uliginosibacterium silvisoli]|uniref:DUF6338 family protein n=1 Tax=Uliginosibacterium silvisoli TaxID=3114758 RepID=UPI003A7F509A
MPELSKDVIALLQYLLPGFLVAWVFYGLTSHSKPSQFERVVQALIFTLGVRVLVFCERLILEYVGQWRAFRSWDSDADLACSLASAISLGFTVAFVINTDRFHGALRSLRLSTRSAHPSEWCGTLSEQVRYVVLNFKDDRRLYGWPKTWPSDPEKGHFFITVPSWIDADGKDHPLESVEGLLVNVADVKWIEFIN